jgi:hypothetical protein
MLTSVVLDRWNTVETWLRGAWPTNKNGLAQFTCSSLFSFDDGGMNCC